VSCKPGGLLFVALPAPLTKRSARRERAVLLRMLRSFGTVELIPDGLEYLTPSFEWEVLTGQGIATPSRWRLGDLAIVRVRSKKNLRRSFSPVCEQPWDFYSIGDLIIRAQAVHPSDQLPVLEPVGRKEYLLESVSRHYLRRRAVNLVTSRGRGARVRQWGILPEVLRLLEQNPSVDISAAVASSAPGLPAHGREQLVASLEDLLTFQKGSE
jgi:hypothetical protein